MFFLETFFFSFIENQYFSLFSKHYSSTRSVELLYPSTRTVFGLEEFFSFVQIWLHPKILPLILKNHCLVDIKLPPSPFAPYCNPDRTYSFIRLLTKVSLEKRIRNQSRMTKILENLPRRNLTVRIQSSLFFIYSLFIKFLKTRLWQLVKVIYSFRKVLKKSHTFFAVKNIFGRFCLLLNFSFCNGGRGLLCPWRPNGHHDYGIGARCKH